MKIILANKFNYLKGGADRYFLELAELLEKNGHEVAKFSMAHAKNLPDKFEKYFVSNIEFNNYKPLDLVRYFFRYFSRIFYSFEAARNFEKLILESKPDIVHLQNIYHQISPSIINVAKKYNLPVVMTLHDYKLICPDYKLFSHGKVCYKCKGGKYYHCALNKCVKNSFFKSLLATLEMYLHHRILKIYDKVDLLIAPSKFMKDVCVEFGINSEKIRIQPNFVDPENYRISDKGSSDDYLLYVGRLSEEKGISILIDSFARSETELKLKIVGDGPEYINLKSKILNLKLEDKVEMLGGKFGEQLNEIFNQAKVLVIPSVWPENLPYVALEAMLFGKLIIAAKIGGLSELVGEGRNGFLFEPGNVDGLSRAIEKIAQVDSKMMSIYAKQQIACFSPQKHLDVITKIYQQYVK